MSPLNFLFKTTKEGTCNLASLSMHGERDAATDAAAALSRDFAQECACRQRNDNDNDEDDRCGDENQGDLGLE